MTAPRVEAPTAALSPTLPGFDTPVRADPMNRAAYQAYVSAWGGRAAAAVTDGSFDVLSISGGGAGGTYGAGVLVGMTEAHTRPQFEIVTGVSTGALIAPIAFLGSDHDELLAEGSEGVGQLTRPIGLGALFRIGIFDGRRLRNLVDRFMTDDIIDAVARASETGRLLVITTTDLDRGETVIWNMSAIAAQGGANGHRLFREVVLASASIPGLFPPVMIEIQDGERAFAEMHVDGGASLPFFVSPDLVTTSAAPAILHGANIYVIDNGQLAFTSRTTPMNTSAIASRAFATVLMHYSRTSLEETDAFARRNGMHLRFTAIPPEYPYAGPLGFDRSSMSALFQYGRRCASESHIWLDLHAAIARAQLTTPPATTPDAAPCPTD
ncbi:patatin-like phospholipase family protein [Terricaulis silvestris]|uniref:patatin-like phospholipase family protein n=1 Tax=Terricaulis silvestris TaxID=2686094 RepID=UPI00131DBED3|nr:patatin-like phospholipase family protein [Terricaulis silvestris]